MITQTIMWRMIVDRVNPANIRVSESIANRRVKRMHDKVKEIKHDNAKRICISI
jgi:hypothetical protein